MIVKIGILTIHSMNLGNRLQNYALQEFLKSRNFEVDTLRREVGEQNKIKLLKQKISCMLKHDKWSCFRWFDTKISWSKDIVSKEKVSENISNHYDYIVAGSDQIWNPNFSFNSELEFMTFVSKEKRVAYAASFGVSSIDSSFEDRYSALLSGIPFCSVREESGKDIIQKLVGKTVDVVPDPTMLITGEQWKEAERKPAIKIKRNFILVYVIGQYTKKMKLEVHEKAKKCDCDVVEIIKDKSKWDRIVGPAEFIWLVRNSEYTFTDSYHGSVLTLILQRKGLTVFSRQDSNKDMSSRFDTLWEMFEIKDIVQKGKKSICVSSRAMNNIENRQTKLIGIADHFFSQLISSYIRG